MIKMDYNGQDKWEERFIGMAREVSTWSKDPSRQIGAVAIDANRRVLSMGYNGFPRGISDLPERYEDRSTKYKYVVHAEMNCIYNATHNGTSLNNSTLYVWGLPVCSECAKGIIQVGVKEVIWATDREVTDTWLESMQTTIELFSEAGVKFKCIGAK